MTENKRKKVSILEICLAKIAEVNKNIETGKKSKFEVEESLKAIDERLINEIKSLNVELSKTEELINVVVNEGLDSQKLHKKLEDISHKISSLEADRHTSSEVTQFKKKLSEIEQQLSESEKLLNECGSKHRLAEVLDSSYVIDKKTGAQLVFEYETLDEALREYIDNIPIIISVSDELLIEKVALWHFPEAPNPIQVEIYAEKGKRFICNQIPNGLHWLKCFASTIYRSLPNSDWNLFTSKGVIFVGSHDDELGEDESTKNWFGDRMSYYYKDSYSNKNAVLEIPEESIFSPEGFRFSPRSGFCYIRSEEKFYSFLHKEFPCSKMVPSGKTRLEEESNRRGVYQHVDVLIPQDIKFDMSVLLNSFGEVLDKKLNDAIAEFNELKNSKSDLALRVLDSVSDVGVLESIFEYRGERLTAKQINDEIGAYWDAFIAAPWESAIVGSVAMIKHLCERKIETPHVWSYPIKGHYGLRVRTRDHDWIIVQIYCPPQYLSPKSPIKHSEVEYSPAINVNSRDKYVTVGPCFFVVYHSER